MLNRPDIVLLHIAARHTLTGRFLHLKTGNFADVIAQRHNHNFVTAKHHIAANMFRNEIAISTVNLPAASWLLSLVEK